MKRSINSENKQSFFWVARQPSVVWRAIKISAIVGLILAVINHGDKLITLSLTSIDLIKILLTFGVPYCVSTFSSVLAIRERTQTPSKSE
ncbi:MAG: nitrate/nitrite transporter NrtS [Alphaproteobacteria bacterium]